MQKKVQRIGDSSTIGLKTESVREMEDVVHCVSEKTSPTFLTNLKTNYQISIIFGMNIPDTTCHQMTIQFPTSPNVCFCSTWGKHSQRNIAFLLLN